MKQKKSHPGKWYDFITEPKHIIDYKPFTTWFIGLVIIILFLLFFFVGRQVLVGKAGYQVGGQPNIAGVSSPDAVIAGELFSVAVYAHLGLGRSTAFQFTVTYDANRLENPVVTLPAGFTEVKKDVSVPGQVLVAGMVLPPRPPVTGEVQLATVQFQVKGNAAQGLAEGESIVTTVPVTELIIFDQMGNQVPFNPPVAGSVQIDARVCENGVTQVCQTGLAGVCADGQQRCTNNRWSACTQLRQPTVEVCDGLNNDCDVDADGNQLIDEVAADSALCPANQACQLGQCVTTCPNGVVDVNLAETCLSCPQDVRCQEGSQCSAQGVCAPIPNPCAGVQCAAGQGCNPADGQCVPLPGICLPACGAGFRCDNNICVPAPQCDIQHPELCLTQETCTTATLHWWNNACHSQPAPVCALGNVVQCSTLAACTAVGGYWYNNACNVQAQCQTSATCPPGQQCTNGVCQVAPPACAPGILVSCTQVNCAGAQGYWYNNVCNTNAQCLTAAQCPANNRCTNGICVAAPPGIPRVVSVAVASGNQAVLPQVTPLARGQTYALSTTINAGGQALPAHIVFVQVIDSNGKVLKLHWERREALAISQSETVSLSYDVSSTVIGPVKLSALAWTDWLQAGGQPLEQTYTEVRYDIR